VSAEEVEKNAVIVCILIQEEVNEAQSAYHLFLAGFLPTQMIKLKTGKISFGINQLLYSGGLFSYLEQFSISANSHKSDLSQSQIIKPQSTDVDLNIFYLNLGDEYFQKGEYAAAINSYNQALQFNNSDADIYYKLGLVNYQLGEYHTAITNYSQAINININHPQAYNQIGLVHYQISNYHIAIEAYTQAIRINPHIAINYKNRADVRSHIGDTQGAIEENMFFLNRATSLDFDDMLASLSAGAAGGVAYGLFENSEQMALNLGFSGFRRGSYDFYKTDWKYLNDASTRGGMANTSIDGILIPAGTSTVYDQQLGTNIRRPFLHVRYRANQADDRRMKNWITGSVGGAYTSDLDAMQVHFLSERCLVTQAANNFVLFTASV
jgi:tetratricopeptide (TPR) repeat protein